MADLRESYENGMFSVLTHALDRSNKQYDYGVMLVQEDPDDGGLVMGVGLRTGPEAAFEILDLDANEQDVIGRIIGAWTVDHDDVLPWVAFACLVKAGPAGTSDGGSFAHNSLSRELVGDADFDKFHRRAMETPMQEQMASLVKTLARNS